MIDVRLLAALNVGYTDQEIIDVVEFLASGIEDGHLRVVNDGDLIIGMKLTALGRDALPTTLPGTSA
jgi:hypothetical protein